MTELLAFSFMQRALLAAVLVGTLCSTVSFFVVLRRLAFLGVGVSHAAMGGIAIGLAVGIEPTLAGMIFAVGAAVGTGCLSRAGKISEYTVIGILHASGMALGIAVISTFKGYYPELFSLLFGNILAVSSRDLAVLGAALLAVLAFLTLFFKELLALCFDEDAALAGGVPVTVLYLGLLAAMGGTVMVSVKLVGIVLASALMVIPGATGYRLSKNFRAMLAWSMATGLGGSAGGLILSFYYPVPPGAAIVLVMTLFFLASLVLRPRRQEGDASVPN